MIKWLESKNYTKRYSFWQLKRKKYDNSFPEYERLSSWQWWQTILYLQKKWDKKKLAKHEGLTKYAQESNGHERFKSWHNLWKKRWNIKSLGVSNHTKLYKLVWFSLSTCGEKNGTKLTVHSPLKWGVSISLSYKMFNITTSYLKLKYLFLQKG